jgi:hypothetical protein
MSMRVILWRANELFNQGVLIFLPHFLEVRQLSSNKGASCGCEAGTEKDALGEVPLLLGSTRVL